MAPPSFVIELTEFSGPLDLLLTLIREEQVDIYDIPIARVAEQFLLRIRTLELNEAADYLASRAELGDVPGALAEFDRHRGALARTLGVGCSQRLHRLHAQILNRDDAGLRPTRYALAHS